MRNSALLILIIFSTIGIVNAQDRFIFDVVELENLWLRTDNAAGALSLDSINLSSVELGSDVSGGDFKSVYNGNKTSDINLNTKSYRRIKNIVLYGELGYNNTSEKNLKYRNNFMPSKVHPYLLVDTLGNTNYTTDHVKINTAVAAPINDYWQWGAKVIYNVGAAGQNKDPRSVNRFLELKINPGIVFNKNNHQIGLSTYYKYYNEDVDAKIIRENTTYTFFQMHGLGQSVRHQAGTYYRLYTDREIGAGLQWHFGKGKQKFLTGINVNASELTVDDGRAATEALWSVVKNDAILSKLNWKIFHSAILKNENSLQRISINVAHQSSLGLEPVQKLENTTGTNQPVWMTKETNRKYFALGFQTEAKYEFLKLFQDGSLKSFFSFESNYNGQEEKYYLPDTHLAYQNLSLATSYLNRWQLNENAFWVKALFSGRFNMGNTHTLDTREAIVEKISYPIMQYFTTNFINCGFETGFEYKMRKPNVNTYVSISGEVLSSHQASKRYFSSIKLGMLF